MTLRSSPNVPVQRCTSLSAKPARSDLAAYLEPQVQNPVALDDHVRILQ